MMYPELVIEHFDNPKNSGEFATNKNIIHVSCGSKSSGDVGQLQLELAGANIIATRFKAYGNPYFIAALSYLTELLTNKNIEQAKAINHDTFVDALDIPNTKLHSALLAEDLLNAAIEAATE